MTSKALETLPSWLWAPWGPERRRGKGGKKEEQRETDAGLRALAEDRGVCGTGAGRSKGVGSGGMDFGGVCGFEGSVGKDLGEWSWDLSRGWGDNLRVGVWGYGNHN